MTDISIHFVKAIVAGAVSRGADRNYILGEAEIPTILLDDKAATVSHQQLAALFRVVWVSTGDEFLGLGKSPCKLGTFRLLAGTLNHFNRLKAALDYASKFYTIVRDDVQFRLSVDGDLATIILHLDCGDADPDNFLQEYYLLAWQKYLCWLVGSQIDWKMTTFSFAKPRHRPLLIKIESGDVQFSRKYCSFSFDVKHLNRVITKSGLDLKHYLNLLPVPIIDVPESGGVYAAQVLEVLRNSEASRLPDLDSIAQVLSVNPRTVHRKLTEEGTSFQEIKNRYRCDIAVRCLTEKDMKIKEVSDYLGFSEPAAFCRFFKKVAGLTPSAYAHLSNI